MRVLDVGCGAGILSEGLAKIQLGEVTGIDPTPKCIELAQAHLDTQDEIKGKVEYRNISVEELLEQTPSDNKYDLVCCSEVVEHVNNQKEFLQTCSQLVKPNGGYMFTSSIAKTPESYIATILLGEKILGIVPNGTHEWDLYINQETV